MFSFENASFSYQYASFSYQYANTLLKSPYTRTYRDSYKYFINFNKSLNKNKKRLYKHILERRGIFLLKILNVLN